MVTSNVSVRMLQIIFRHSNHFLSKVFIFSMSLFTEDDQMKCPMLQLSSVAIKIGSLWNDMRFFISILYLFLMNKMFFLWDVVAYCRVQISRLLECTTSQLL